MEIWGNVSIHQLAKVLLSVAAHFKRSGVKAVVCVWFKCDEMLSVCNFPFKFLKKKEKVVEDREEVSGKCKMSVRTLGDLSLLIIVLLFCWNCVSVVNS